MTLTRISITIPQPLVAAADRLASSLDRSRSWVVAEAVRRYTEQADDEEAETAQRSVRQVAPEPHCGPGLGEHRQAQLEADLALTPEQRVREAEGSASLSQLGQPGWGWQRLLVFDRYEDYLTWGRWADLSPP